jgi:hypothetical protein
LTGRRRGRPCVKQRQGHEDSSGDRSVGLSAAPLGPGATASAAASLTMGHLPTPSTPGPRQRSRSWARPLPTTRPPAAKAMITGRTALAWAAASTSLRTASCASTWTLAASRTTPPAETTTCSVSSRFAHERTFTRPEATRSTVRGRPGSFAWPRQPVAPNLPLHVQRELPSQNEVLGREPRMRSPPGRDRRQHVGDHAKDGPSGTP